MKSLVAVLPPLLLLLSCSSGPPAQNPTAKAQQAQVEAQAALVQLQQACRLQSQRHQAALDTCYQEFHNHKACRAVHEGPAWQRIQAICR